ncbi:PEP-CTERM sorting domain-containing protein [Rhodobacteraceae bacterium R_SAG10]|nr:PEP-CTERM sorting domain-containing protein [Rhodobacteraceae bacterium R_SAG10]
MLSFSWSGLSSQGAGLSHFVALGNVPIIPVPAAGLLLLSALGGLGFASSRRRRRTA